jgi:iron complex outermembrane receptor protein
MKRSATPVRNDSRLGRARRLWFKGVLAVFWLNAGLAVPAGAQTNQVHPPAELKKLTMEQLMNLEVTTVSRGAERLADSPSAIQVLTGEDIRRSGAMHLADALRLAPNLQVQQVSSHTWVVSSRGFATLFANKLLVMIDGRSVYSPLDAGVFWDAQNVLLDDVDRIEVISGPGGSLWGANAVNGVINIITKGAAETQGLYVSGAGGSFLQDYGAVRYGGQAGSNLFYRIYGMRFDRGSTLRRDGGDGGNSWNLTQGGFRLDYLPSTANTLTLQGDYYGGVENNAPGPTNSHIDGQNILGRWTRTFSPDSDLTVQMYFDRTWRRDIPSVVTDEMNTTDFDFQHRFSIGERQTVLWGGGYRLMQDEARTGTPTVGLIPERRNMQLFSGFLQDELVVIPEQLRLTLGTKLERNDFSGLEFLPSGRLTWKPAEAQTVWAAISRAVRSPSRIDTDLYRPKFPPFGIAGGRDMESEKLLAYELGYRLQATRSVSLSWAAFYNDYDDLYSVELQNPPAPLPYVIRNGTDGQAWGAEFSGTYQACPWWRLRGGYTYVHRDVWNKPRREVPGIVLDSLGNDPPHQVVLQSMVDLPMHFQLDGVARFVDRLRNPDVPHYFTCDLRLAWQFKAWELAVVGQNLWDNQHPEFNRSQEVPRSVYGRVTWRF